MGLDGFCECMMSSSSAESAHVKQPVVRIDYQCSLLTGAAPDRILHGLLVVSLVRLVDARLLPTNQYLTLSTLRTRRKFYDR